MSLSQHAADKLTPYENEEQLNHLLDSSSKPVVVYYYLAAHSAHSQMRSHMKKYSHLCGDSASWVLCNLQQHFLQAVTNPLTRFEQETLMVEVRRPRQAVSMADGSQQNFQAYSTAVYSGDHTESCFRAFLRDNGILPRTDQLEPALTVARNAVFREW